MGDITTTCTFTPTQPEMNYRKIVVYTLNTADNGDTFTVTLATYGIGKVLYVRGWGHSTEDSIVVADAITTSVTAGVLTVTLGTTGANKKRVIEICGRPLA